MGTRGVTLLGHGLQAAQHHLLQPLGQFGAQLARRHRVHPQPLAHATRSLRFTKGQLAGAQLVEHDANGKQVAARVAAHAHHLFGGNPCGRAHGFAQLLRQQIGKMRVAGQAKVQQHGLPPGAYEYVGGLKVQVHHVLLVQRVHGAGNGGAQLGNDLVVWQRALVNPVVQRAAVHVLHHQVGHALQVACGHKARYMGALQGLHDLALHLKAHDVFATVARSHARYLHGHGKAGIALALRVVHAVDVGHATRVDAFFDFKSVQDGAVFQ